MGLIYSLQRYQNTQDTIPIIIIHDALHVSASSRLRTGADEPSQLAVCQQSVSTTFALWDFN